MVNGQALPVQLICHTEPYKNYDFQIDGISSQLTLASDSEN